MVTTHPAVEFLSTLFNPEDQIRIFTKLPLEPGQNRPRNFRVTAGEACSEESIESLHKANADRQVYVSMATFKPDAADHTKESVDVVKCVYADLDTDGPAALALLESCVDAGEIPPPTFVNQTAPEKFHVIWRVDGLTKEIAEGLNKALAAKFGGDPAVVPASQVLRIPEFKNLKPAYPDHIVKIIKRNPGVYVVNDFKIVLPPVAEAKTHNFPDPEVVKEQARRARLFTPRSILACAEHYGMRVRKVAGNKVGVHSPWEKDGHAGNPLDAIIYINDFGVPAFKDFRNPDKTLDDVRRFYEDAGAAKFSFEKWADEQDEKAETSSAVNTTTTTAESTLPSDPQTATNETGTALPPSNPEFKKPQVIGGAFDYVFAAPTFLGSPVAGYEGWFALGSVHQIGGASGSGKTTLMVPLLVSQSKGEECFGRKTFGLPYLMLLADRGKHALTRTTTRLRVTDQVGPNIVGIPPCVDKEALKHIQDAIEARPLMPAIVFIEGADLLVSDSNSQAKVGAFVGRLNRIAEYYHLAIVCSVGSKKMMKGEAFQAKRSCLYGAESWGRTSETIMVMEGSESEIRTLSVMSRNGKSETFKLDFKDGLLVKVEVPENVDAEDSIVLKYAKDHAGEYWTRKALQNDLALSKTKALKLIDQSPEIKQKPGPGNQILYTYRPE